MNTRMRLLFALWLIITGSMGSPVPCAADTTVTLHSDNELRRAIVKLSDLFNGVPPGIDRAIAQAPPPGNRAVYDASLLVKLADKYRLDWTPQGNADHVVITTASTHITTDDLREAVVKKVKAAGVIGEIDVSFDTRNLEIDLPATEAPLFTLNNFEYDPISKRFHADFATETGQDIGPMPINGRVTVKRHVPVLAHRLEGGTVIGAGDVDWIYVADDRVNDSVVMDAGQLVGRELRHSTSEDEILHTNDVLPPRLVKRGSLVTMKIETPLMVVAAQGKALQDGALGDVVRVLNTQSNRTIEGTVDSSGTVVVLTSQKLASVQ